MSKLQIPYGEAVAYAEKIQAALAPACDRIEIAGSIRRKRPYVGDIELVAVPRLGEDLLGEPAASELDALLRAKVEEGSLEHTGLSGPKYKRYRLPKFKGCQLDLFLTSAERWGVIFAIRTGPAAYSHRIVTPAALGGKLDGGYKVERGRLWMEGKPVETPKEKDFLVHCGGYLEPELRV